MKVGDKYVLHSNAFPWMDKEPDEFKIVTVVEVRNDVKDMWTGERKHTGLRAKDEDGVEYFCNWESFPSDSMTPQWSWMCKEPLSEWYDLVYVTRMGQHPTKVPKIVAKQDFIKFCPEHKDFYYVRNETGCFDCYMEKKYGKKKQVIKNTPSPWGTWRGQDGTAV